MKRIIIMAVLIIAAYFIYKYYTNKNKPANNGTEATKNTPINRARFEQQAENYKQIVDASMTWNTGAPDESATYRTI